MYDYQAQVLNVHDGDTLRLRTDLGFYVRFDQTVRLAGLNAPELSTPEGQAAKAFAESWIADHVTPAVIMTTIPALVGVRTQKDKQEKYGRYLATIYDLADATSTLNAALLAAGHALPWDGTGPRPI